MMKTGDIVTIAFDVIRQDGVMLFNAGEKVKVREASVDEGHYSKLCPDLWIPERLTGVLLEDYYGFWSPSTFCEWKIGKKVAKSRSKKGVEIFNRKKFKSGNYINTVKGVIDHPKLHIPAYTFEEDESYVECRRCQVAEDELNKLFN